MNLGELLHNVYFELGQLYISKATGGDTTSIIDSRSVDVFGEDDHLFGTAFIIETTDGLAPEGQFAQVTAHDPATGDWTVDALTAAVGSGDVFGVTTSLFPLQVMIRAVNAGLRALGELALVDITTLDIVANQSEYAAALAWKRRRPREIAVAMNADANDQQWMPYYDFDWIPSAPGTTGKIIFRTMPPTGDVRVVYDGVHPDVSVYSDAIAEAVDRDKVVQLVADKALAWINGLFGGTDEYMLQRWQKAQADVRAHEFKNPVDEGKPRERPKLFTVSKGWRGYWPGDRNPV